MIYKNFSQKDFDEAEKSYNECAKKHTPAVPQRKKLSKGQTTALFIAFLILIYSIFTRLLYYIDTRNNNNGIDTHYSLEFAAVTALLINNNDNYYKFSDFLKDNNLKIKM